MAALHKGFALRRAVEHPSRISDMQITASAWPATRSALTLQSLRMGHLAWHAPLRHNAPFPLTLIVSPRAMLRTDGGKSDEK